MKLCKNCGKGISDNLTFCNKQCLSEYQIKKESDPSKSCPISTKIIESKETISEIKEVISCLGRTASEGSVRGEHLGKILSVCRNPPTRIKTCRDLTAYLALICGMQQRYIKENYLDGLEIVGVIDTIMVNNDKFFKWIGMKAFERNTGE